MLHLPVVGACGEWLVAKGPTTERRSMTARQSMWLIVLLLIARVTGTLFIFSGVSKLMARAAFVAPLHALPFVPLWSVAGVT